jgi:hypothetical protein
LLSVLSPVKDLQEMNSNGNFNFKLKILEKKVFPHPEGPTT